MGFSCRGCTLPRMVEHFQDDDNDDAPVGRVLSRREIIALFGGTGILALIGCGGSGGTTTTTSTSSTGTNTTGTGGSTGSTASSGGTVSCVVASPELTEGPYFVDERLNRADIRGDREGVPLQFVINLVRIQNGGCTALVGAMVDVWHCDAAGKYSDIASEGTTGQNWLRGYQVTDENGRCEITSIYPGWYSGRAVHVHFKIRATVDGQTYEFTSQFFFDETVTDTVHAQSPYNAKGTRNVRNSQDGIYNQGGNKLMLALTPSGGGYIGTFDVGLTV